MSEATLYQTGDGVVDHTAVAAITGGQVIQLPDGRAAVINTDIAAAGIGGARTEGIFDVAKTASIVMLAGQKAYWDHSANAVTFRANSDKDFFIGTLTADAASAATTCRVSLNTQPQYIINLHDSAFDHVPVLTSGTPSLTMVGGTARAAFSATAEAQKLDLLSKRSFPADANWILEAVVEVSTTADADVADLNIGVANGTHASDADSITESVFVHFDLGADLDIDAESDDGTTEVAATDTTVNFVVGTPLHIMLDGRTETDVQIYINGVNVLPDSVFTLADATGPLKALFHLEKSSNDTLCVVELDEFNVRITNE